MGERLRPAAVSFGGWGWRHASRHAWAARDIDLVIEPGERVLLLGASGAGKSTLLHALAGVLGGDDEGEERGKLLVDGAHPRSIRGRSGLVLQDPDSQVILDRLGDDVAFGCENLGVRREEIWPRVDAALRAVGLDYPRDHSTSRLSGGEKQRLALAGALAMQPGLLLLDEPTANLDQHGVREVTDAVASVLESTGATLVVVEHRVNAWLPLIDRVIVLAADGGILADGDPTTIFSEHGTVLRAAGIWVPHSAQHPSRRAREADAPLLLETERLSVGRRASSEVQSNINLSVRAGRALAITGPNGSGKSTLALTIAGLVPPLAGRVVATSRLSRGLSADPIRWKSRDLLTRIATVFQEPEHQFLRSTVRDELEVGPRVLRLGDHEVSRRVDTVLQRLRLDSLARAHPFTLSGGEKRRLSVATALVVEPSVMVLDEPTFGQDANTWAELTNLLSDIRDRGTAVVAVSHDHEFVDAFADARIELSARSTGQTVTV